MNTSRSRAFTPPGDGSHVMTDAYPRSRALYERACRTLAGGVSSEFRKSEQPHPLFYVRGRGARVEDVDGHEFLDFTLSQGPLILGHCHPAVVEAVQAQAREGQLYAGQHLGELELAETLARIIPGAERLRFCLTGSEAVHGALRVARGLTGRGKFLRFEGHYHGWLDNVAVGIAPATGSGEPPPIWTAGLPPAVQDESIVLPWNDLALVERVIGEHHRDIATVLTEPVMCNTGCIPPESGFLEGLRAICDRYRILLIFDEVITGFRLAMGGAQAYFGVTPDLAVFGKALASGHPISALVGKADCLRQVADGEIVLAGTMNACNSSVAAALATLGTLSADGVHERLFRLGERLMRGLREAGAHLDPPLRVQGPGPMFHAGFSALERVRDAREARLYDSIRYGRFVRAMQARGVRLIGRGLWYLCAAHTEADVDDCLAAARDALKASSAAG